jgi:hypothetical protein
LVLLAQRFWRDLLQTLSISLWTGSPNTRRQRTTSGTSDGTDHDQIGDMPQKIHIFFNQAFEILVFKRD